jgi:hypothetical protein
MPGSSRTQETEYAGAQAVECGRASTHARSPRGRAVAEALGAAGTRSAGAAARAQAWGASSKSSTCRGERRAAVALERPGRGAWTRPDAGAGRAQAELAARHKYTRAEVAESCCAESQPRGGAGQGTEPLAEMCTGRGRSRAPGGEVQGSCSCRGVGYRCSLIPWPPVGAVVSLVLPVAWLCGEIVGFEID